MSFSFTVHKYLCRSGSQTFRALPSLEGKKKSKQRSRWALQSPWPFCQSKDKATLPVTEKPGSSENQEGMEIGADLPTAPPCSKHCPPFKGTDNPSHVLYLTQSLVWWVGEE